MATRRVGWEIGHNLITYYSQRREPTGIQADHPEWDNLHRRVVTGRLKCFDLAYQA